MVTFEDGYLTLSGVVDHIFEDGDMMVVTNDGGEYEVRPENVLQVQ